MARHTNVAKGYSNYDDYMAQEGSYPYMPGHHVLYVVETRTVERVRGPASRYPRFGGAPLNNEHLKVNMPRHAPMDRYGGYEQYYGSGYEHSSPSRYHERENLMENFLNKLKIGAGPPTYTSNHSGTNKYRPTSPNKYRLKSPDKYQPISPNRYLPTSPNKYRPRSPDSYQSTSLDKYHPTDPNKHRFISPNKYKSASPTKIRPTSPNNFRPKSPIKYQSTSPNKYRPTSPNKHHPKSPNKHQLTSPIKYRPSSPVKHQPTSPTKYQPTSSTNTYPSKEANMIMAKPLPAPIKYRPTSPNKHEFKTITYDFLPQDHMKMSQNKPNLNKYRPTSPVYNSPSKEGQPIRTQSFSDPNKNHSSSIGAEGGEVDFLSPNYHRQSVGPPTTRRPLMTPTNNINEALGSLIESVNYSPRSSNPAREGEFGNLYPRAQPIEHERQYARNTYGGVANQPYLNRSNTIDSHEAVRRYNGAYVK